jgi:hypothetical protein
LTNGATGGLHVAAGIAAGSVLVATVRRPASALARVSTTAPAVAAATGQG